MPQLPHPSCDRQQRVLSYACTPVLRAAVTTAHLHRARSCRVCDTRVPLFSELPITTANLYPNSKAYEASLSFESPPRVERCIQVFEYTPSQLAYLWKAGGDGKRMSIWHRTAERQAKFCCIKHPLSWNVRPCFRRLVRVENASSGCRTTQQTRLQYHIAPIRGYSLPIHCHLTRPRGLQCCKAV